MTEIAKLKEILEGIHREVKDDQAGEVANYIPELGCVDPNKFGMHITTLDGSEIGVGDDGERFSIQSITKTLLLARAILEVGPKLIERVGVEPSGDPFNCLIQLEYERGIPRNPMINAGAIVVCDVLVELFDDPKKEYLRSVRQIAGCDTIDYVESVAQSEWSQGFRNRSIINFMRSYGNIHCDIDAVLDLYFYACSIAMSCRELSRTFTLFANGGSLLSTGESLLSPTRAKRINAIMLTCGLYDEAGEFASQPRVVSAVESWHYTPGNSPLPCGAQDLTQRGTPQRVSVRLNCSRIAPVSRFFRAIIAESTVAQHYARSKPNGTDLRGWTINVGPLLAKCRRPQGRLRAMATTASSKHEPNEYIDPSHQDLSFPSFKSVPLRSKP